MTSEQPKHCDHKCVCPRYLPVNPFAQCGITDCEYDIRSRPHPAPAISFTQEQWEITIKATREQAARQAREDVLKEINNIMETELQNDVSWEDSFMNVKVYVSLRQHTGQVSKR